MFRLQTTTCLPYLLASSATSLSSSSNLGSTRLGLDLPAQSLRQCRILTRSLLRVVTGNKKIMVPGCRPPRRPIVLFIKSVVIFLHDGRRPLDRIAPLLSSVEHKLEGFAVLLVFCFFYVEQLSKCVAPFRLNHEPCVAAQRLAYTNLFLLEGFAVLLWFQLLWVEKCIAFFRRKRPRAGAPCVPLFQYNMRLRTFLMLVTFAFSAASCCRSAPRSFSSSFFLRAMSS